MSEPAPTRNHPSTTWAENDLIRRLCSALDIAKRAIGLLGESGYWDEETPEDSFGRDKPLAEAAMFLHVASAVTGHAEIKRRVDELSFILEPHARSHSTACSIAFHPTICFQLAMPHILLGQLGLYDRNFDGLLALSAGSQAWHGREVVPHRALEGMWLESLWSGKSPGPEFDETALNSVMNHPVDLLWGCREDAYAHTHAFMYFTNFGYSPRALPRRRSVLLAESAGLLTRGFLLEDFDLAAEVLMAWPLTSTSWPPTAVFGLRVLADLEDKVGFLPAGNGVPEKFDRLTGSERTKYALAASYHTTFVMGMLCALALRPGNTPPFTISGASAPAELIEELLSIIPKANTPWQNTFSQLAPEEQRTLGSFLMDMALLAGCRSKDFSSVGRLLELAVQHGLANTPLCSQAAELTHRIAACADGHAD